MEQKLCKILVSKIHFMYPLNKKCCPQNNTKCILKRVDFLAQNSPKCTFTLSHYFKTSQNAFNLKLYMCECQIEHISTMNLQN
jgi:hypothetical protein